MIFVVIGFEVIGFSGKVVLRAELDEFNGQLSSLLSRDMCFETVMLIFINEGNIVTT